MSFLETTGAEEGAETIAIVDIIVIDVGASVIASVERIIVVVLPGEPL